MSLFDPGTPARPPAPPLTQAEARDLERLESDIETGLAHFRRVGLALREISERKLYRQDYPNFDAYCRERWGFARSQAYRSIAAAKIVEDVCGWLSPGEAQPVGQPAKPPVRLPETVRQALPLGRLGGPKEQAEVWQRAVEEAGGKSPPTSRVEELVALAESGGDPEAIARLVEEEEREILAGAGEAAQAEGAEDLEERKRRCRTRLRQAYRLAASFAGEGWAEVARLAREAMRAAQGAG